MERHEKTSTEQGFKQLKLSHQILNTQAGNSHIHFVRSPEAAGESVLAGQAVQFASEIAATISEYVPLAHAKQSPIPRAAFHFPGTHLLQFTPLAFASYPTRQLQSVNRLLPGPELVPVGHVRHVALETAAVAPEYCPSRQLVHVAEPFVPLYVPANH